MTRHEYEKGFADGEKKATTDLIKEIQEKIQSMPESLAHTHEKGQIAGSKRIDKMDLIFWLDARGAA